MSTTLTTKTTTKTLSRRLLAKRQRPLPARRPPYRTEAGELVPQDGIIDIDGPGIEFEGGADEKGDFKPLPVEQRLRRPSHPGSVLAHLFLPPTGVTQGELADRLGVSRRTINMIINGSRPVTVDMAHRLARAFGTGAEFWLGLQRKCDLWDAAHANSAAYEQIQPIGRPAGE